MHFVALLAASFITALNALRQCHFWHHQYCCKLLE